MQGSMQKVPACFGPGGYQSYAPAMIPDGCQPGFIPPGCKAVRRFTATIGAVGTVLVRVDPFQPLKVGALVTIGVASDILLTDWTVDEQSLFPRVQNDGSATFVAGLGDIDALSAELYRSGLNPLPPQPAIDNNNPAIITFTSVAGGVLDMYIYFVNP